jgi:hypothetical protein
MNLNPRKQEKGQTLIIFAVVMVVLVALTALVIDGGFAYTKRREAQNAADAGALAGANALCAGNEDEAIPQALDYAINRNGAADATANLGTKSITVTTTIPQETFLAGIFGYDEVTTHASASAGCYVPCEGIGVLPVAWACQPPAGGVITDTCSVQFGSDNLYIIMDSKKSGDDFFCQEPPNSGLPAGTLDCDIDNDGVNDLETGGNRSWLDLTGSAGAGDLKDWVRNGFPGKLVEHTWFGGQAGVADSIFQAVFDRVGTVVILPVFDSYCKGNPNSACPSDVHPQDQIVVSGGTSQTYFHVITFSAFHITCVSAPPGSNKCPGKDAVWAANPTELKKSDYNKIKTIEGYFVKDYFGSGKCDGPSAGIYTIYLNH